MIDVQPDIIVKLTNKKVQFKGISRSNPEHPVTFDFYPPIGDGQGYTGLELLLMSFSGCVATTVLYLLRKMGKNISKLTVNANGIRRDKPPIKFQEIFLEFILTSEDTKDADIQKVIQLAEESACPVWQMLKNNVEVLTEYKIV